MLKARPFASVDALIARANEIWRHLTSEDHLEAFAAHPRIGEQREGRDTHARWSRSEQSRASSGDDTVMGELLRLNQEYEARHGFVFLICASGKSADEILGSLRERLGHSREEELSLAAEEQRRITELRLRRLLES